MLTAQELEILIRGCARNDRESQKRMYSSFYAYAMSICYRYATNDEDAREVLNDGFLKIFMEIYRFQPSYADSISSFKGWLRKIMVHTAIDHFRKNKKYQLVSEFPEDHLHIPAEQADALDKLSYDELAGAIKYLTPAYRTVFNLYVMEGYTHDEIAQQLEISTGTSKSNLAKARKQLQKILFQQNDIKNRNVV